MTDHQSSHPPTASDSRQANTDDDTIETPTKDNQELAEGRRYEDVVGITTSATTEVEDVNLDTADKVERQHQHQQFDTVHNSNTLSPKNLSPFVHWNQSASHISLRVDLLEVKDLNINIRDDGHGIEFSAKGRGAQGLQDYSFSFDFYSQVKEKLECCQIERNVLILVEKSHISKNNNWPRLTKQRVKLPWLRFDFDRYNGEDSDDITSNEEDNISKLRDLEETGERLCESGRDESPGSKSYNKKQKQQRSSHNSESLSKNIDNILNYRTTKDIFNPFNKRNINENRDLGNMKYDHRRDSGSTTENRKNCARNGLDYKKTYLFLYNLGMFVMFLKIYLVLLIKVVTGTIDDDIVLGAAFIIKTLTYTQLLETIHPILKLVPGGPLMPFTQVIGRILVNYFLTEPIIRLDSAPYAHYLFIVWSSIEIFRYSYYALRVFNLSIYPLTWCRYTLFLPLYPMGGFCESMVLFSTIKYYEKTGGYSINLPNSANISFYLPVALRIYIFLLLGPTIYSLMRYMWKQRTQALKRKVD